MSNFMMAYTLDVKKNKVTKTVDQYNTVFLKYPKDCGAVLSVVCQSALLVPQIDYGSGMSYRCFGNTEQNKLSTMIGETIDITMYYI